MLASADSKIVTQEVVGVCDATSRVQFCISRYRWFVLTRRNVNHSRDWRQSDHGYTYIPSGCLLASRIVLRARNAFFHAYAKLIGKIAVIVSFGSGLSATQRDSNEVIPCISYQPRASPSPSRIRHATQSRTPAREVFSTERAERAREQPKRCDHVAIARWQKCCQCHCDCRPT